MFRFGSRYFANVLGEIEIIVTQRFITMFLKLFWFEI